MTSLREVHFHLQSNVMWLFFVWCFTIAFCPSN